MEKKCLFNSIGKKNRFPLLLVESPDFPSSGVNGFQDLGEKKNPIYINICQVHNNHLPV